MQSYLVSMQLEVNASKVSALRLNGAGDSAIAEAI